MPGAGDRTSSTGLKFFAPGPYTRILVLGVTSTQSEADPPAATAFVLTLVAIVTCWTAAGAGKRICGAQANTGARNRCAPITNLLSTSTFVHPAGSWGRQPLRGVRLPMKA